MLMVDQEEETARIAAVAHLADVAAGAGRPAGRPRPQGGRQAGAGPASSGLPMLLLVAPLLAVAALAVELDSPGPIFFRQRRHGFNNEEITGSASSARCGTRPPTRGPSAQVTAGDDRVTRVGRVLRKTSVDELPQLLNVIRGEMSLVGPRPHAVGMKTGEVESAQLVAEYAHRHRIKPGLTGLGRGERLPRPAAHAGGREAAGRAGRGVHRTADAVAGPEDPAAHRAPAARRPVRRALSRTGRRRGTGLASWRRRRQDGGHATPLIIDTDPGVDDAVALILALHSPEVQVRAVTATLRQRRGLSRPYGNARRVLALAGRADVPVARRGRPAARARPRRARRRTCTAPTVWAGAAPSSPSRTAPDPAPVRRCRWPRPCCAGPTSR